ncbi:TRAP transporter permease [Alkalilacustris brevis]|uniref:TRAP transporter permease n=1 Tax=Alkalilacustris brevis TaxID=2026338 RepID=UPI000E0D691A|nr:TRAP transporter fused permease subunit [Alkalilacustris brevis]
MSTQAPEAVAEQEGGLKSRLSHPLIGPLFVTAAVITSAIHVYFNSLGLMSELRFAAIHFGLFGFIGALLFPFRKSEATTVRGISLDLLVGSIALFCGIYFLFNDYDYWARGGRMAGIDPYVALAAVAVALELLRRTMGIFIPLLILFMLSYAGFWGQHISGVFRFPSISANEILARSYFGDLGLFGQIAQISMTYVFMFVLFGAFLVKSGAAEFIIDLARSVARRAIGGSGMVAVMGSALMGSINGSAVGNIATTGVVTIPLMKRSGYTPRFAAAVETAASTGGPLLPPIMGAGAFVMSSYTQIPYVTIAAVSVLPALLYFASVLFFVRMEAIREGATEFVDPDARPIARVLKDGWHTLMPVLVLVALLVVGYSATYSAAGAIVSVIVFSWLSPRNRMGPRQVVEAMIDGTRNATPTAILLVAIGLLVGILGTTGFGPTFSLMILEWSRGSLLLMLLFIVLVSLVLGMGLPVTAAYIVLATISAPSLADLITSGHVIDMMVAGNLPDQAGMFFQLAEPAFPAMMEAGLTAAQARALLDGLPLELRATLRPMVLEPELMMLSLLSAHMIIFWLSQDSNVTPPVCLPAFVAAAIAGSAPMRTGLTAFRLAKGLYIVPLLFAFTPLLSGDWGTMMTIFLPALIGIHALAAALSGVIEHRAGLALRLVSLLLGAVLLWPLEAELKIIPAALYLGLLWWSWRRRLAQAEALPAR